MSNYIVFSLTVELSEPPAKRLGTAICLCSKCNGQERDFRTVDRHMREVFESQFLDSSISTPPQLSPQNPPSPELSLESSELSLDLTSAEPTLDENESVEPLQCRSSDTSLENSVSKRQIQKFTFKEVKLKLDHGHSISTTEEHLQNAAELLDCG